MSTPQEDPNIEFLKKLDLEMTQNRAVYHLVTQVITKTVEAMVGNYTDRHRAMKLGRAATQTTDEIMKIFRGPGDDKITRGGTEK